MEESCTTNLLFFIEVVTRANDDGNGFDIMKADEIFFLTPLEG